jgi:hypothetical protein
MPEKYSNTVKQIRVNGCLKSFEELEKCFLGHLAASPLQIGETSQPEVRVQVVSGRVKRTSNGQSVRVGAEFELGSLGMLKFCSGLGSLMMLLQK